MYKGSLTPAPERVRVLVLLVLLSHRMLFLFLYKIQPNNGSYTMQVAKKKRQSSSKLTVELKHQHLIKPIFFSFYNVAMTNSISFCSLMPDAYSMVPNWGVTCPFSCHYDKIDFCSTGDCLVRLPLNPHMTWTTSLSITMGISRDSSNWQHLWLNYNAPHLFYAIYNVHFDTFLD